MAASEIKSWIFLALPYLSAIGLVAASLVAISGLVLRVKTLKNEKERLAVEKQLMLWIHDTDLETNFDQRVREFENEAIRILSNSDHKLELEGAERTIARLSSLIDDIKNTRDKVRLISEATSEREGDVFMHVKKYSEDRLVMFSDEIDRLYRVIRLLESRSGSNG